MRSGAAFFRIMILCLTLSPGLNPLFAQTSSTLRYKFIPVQTAPFRLDTLSIVFGSFSIKDIPQQDYRIDYNNALLQWINKPPLKEVEVVYRVLPLFIGAETRSMSFDSVMNRFMVVPDQLKKAGRSPNPFDFGKIRSNGSLGRSLAFGNRQDAVLNSSLNLQLNGYIGDSILLSAAISDNNIPIQPDGNTQNLNEFDQVFIQFSKDKWKLSVGDLDIRQNQLYFLSFYKRLQGISYEAEQKISHTLKNKVMATGAIAKGKFTRNVFQGIEGNQGPYRLKGANQELFFIVLAGTERVFIDGMMMQRGEDQDYVINYNTAEITFMPRQMITKDKRIQIEFEYADRNYLNTQFYFNDAVQVNERLNITVGYFGNADARNASINQTLNTGQKQFLADLGDNVNNAFYPSAVLDTFSTTSILYRKVDTVYAGGKRDTIYVYEKSNLQDLYSLSFTDFGEGGGSYILDQTASANGKVFKWVAPDLQTGKKNGRYDPLVLLVPPKRQNLMSIAAHWKLGNQTEMAADFAGSRYDVNRLSSKDKFNDAGFAGRMVLRNQKSLNASQGLSLKTEINTEFASARFKPVERLRSVEFTRDWGLDLVTTAADEKILHASMALTDKKAHQVKYSFGNYQRDQQYRAARHDLEHSINENGWRMNNQFAITQFSDPLLEGYFLRPVVDVSRRFASLKNKELGVKYTMERTLSANLVTDSLTGNSFSFSTLQVSALSDPSKLNKWGLSYFTRMDELPDGKSLVKQDRSHNFNVSSELMSDAHHQFRLFATYRKLNQYSTTPSTPSEDALLGRAEYFTDIWKGAITGNALYELGAGQEPRKEFTYFEVPAGQGEYTWIDYNQDGIQQLNEFEVSRFRDQAKFFRIFTPTNEFIRANYLQFNYNLIFNPSIALGSTTSSFFHALIRRIYMQSSLQVGQKQMATGSRDLNPFYGMIQDTSLITFNQIQSHTFSFNKFSQVWGADVNFLQTSNRDFLSYGYETRRVRDLSLKIRSNWFRKFTLDLIGKANRNLLETPNFSNRNYNVLSLSYEPRITYTKGTNLRLISGYKRDQKQNAGNERATINAVLIEGKYNLVSNTSLGSRLNYSNIVFSGVPSTTLGYIMLDGLQPGKNLIWTVDLTKRLGPFIEMSIQYEGRKSGSSGLVNIGRAQVRAIL